MGREESDTTERLTHIQSFGGGVQARSRHPPRARLEGYPGLRLRRPQFKIHLWSEVWAGTGGVFYPGLFALSVFLLRQGWQAQGEVD